VLSGIDFVFLPGHPASCLRFGFESSGDRGFDDPFPIDEENADAWMVNFLRKDRVDVSHHTAPQSPVCGCTQQSGIPARIEEAMVK
jgi:hypothetical protein